MADSARIQRGVFRFTGFEVLAPQVVYAPVRLAEAERKAALDAWAVRLCSIGQEKPIVVGEY